MDYTLASTLQWVYEQICILTIFLVYTQEYEFLEYELAIEKLLQMGYPKSISELKYDPNYSIRYTRCNLSTL